MDLYEYQAKELFAKHGVPTTPGRVAATAEEAEAIAAEIGKPVMVKAQVKVGGRGKAGGVKYAADVAAARAHAEAILGMDIKGHTVHQRARRRGERHRGGVLHLLPARPRQPHLPGHVLGRGRRGDRGHRRGEPRRAGEGPGRRRRSAWTWRSPAPSPSRQAPRGGARRRGGDHRRAVEGLRRRGRDPGRGQPARAHPGRPDPRARRQGHPRRERRLPAGRPRATSPTRRPPTRWRPRRRPRASTTSSSTARSASSATARGSS